MAKRHNASPITRRRRGGEAFQTLGSAGERSDGPHSAASAAHRRKRIAFPYYGGKFVHLDFLLPLLPIHYTHFCEPFGGSAAVLLNRPPAPIETYNDLDSGVVNFFRCLRSQRNALIRAIRLTPYSLEEHAKACASEKGLSSLERARRFFIRARQTFNSLAQTPSSRRWSRSQLIAHRGMAGVVSRWLSGTEALSGVVERLRRVQIEHAPAIEIIRRYDSPQTLFYCDPPYPHESRVDRKAYAFEMSDPAHEELAAMLHAVRGAVAISGYRCPLMDRIYRDWRRVDARPRYCNPRKSVRVESVWMNYDPPARALEQPSRNLHTRHARRQ